MRIISQIIAVAVLLTSIAQAQEQDVRSVVQALQTHSLSAEAFSKMPVDTQRAVTDQLTAQALDGDILADGALIRLQNEDAISRVIATYTNSDGKDRFALKVMEQSKSPWLIPQLEASLFQDEKAQYRQVDQDFMVREDYGLSWTTGKLIKQIVATSPNIPADTRKWADTLTLLPSNEFLINMRLWYEQNNEALADEDYQEVKPLKKLKTSVPEESPDSIQDEVQSATINATTNELASNKLSQVEQVAHDDNRNFPYLIWVLGFVVVFGLVIGFFTIKASKSNS